MCSCRAATRLFPVAKCAKPPALPRARSCAAGGAALSARPHPGGSCFVTSDGCCLRTRCQLCFLAGKSTAIVCPLGSNRKTFLALFIACAPVALCLCSRRLPPLCHPSRRPCRPPRFTARVVCRPALPGRPRRLACLTPSRRDVLLLRCDFALASRAAMQCTVLRSPRRLLCRRLRRRLTLPFFIRPLACVPNASWQVTPPRVPELAQARLLGLALFPGPGLNHSVIGGRDYFLLQNGQSLQRCPGHSCAAGEAALSVRPIQAGFVSSHRMVAVSGRGPTSPFHRPNPVSYSACWQTAPPRLPQPVQAGCSPLALRLCSSFPSCLQFSVLCSPHKLLCRRLLRRPAVPWATLAALLAPQDPAPTRRRRRRLRHCC